ncbi:MAG: MurT ligase domain-containing protein, partial [Syntrophomonadaceae bacterium]
MKTIAFILAVLVGKILILLSRLLGNQGSNFPGKVARRIYPLILRELATKVDGKIIVITGTNGKTTTSNMLAQIIKETGANLVHNQAGANMISGITTAFIEKTNLTGNRHFDFALLETDEANIPILLKEVNAGLVVITNFFRDQLDRYGELDNTIQVIKNALDNKKLDLLLNADDPLTAHFQNLRLVNCRYYGLISPNYATNYSNESREGRYCVNCGQELEYSAYFYAQLGKFLCPGCGNHNPQVDFSGHNLVMNPTIQIMVEEIPLKSPYQGFYNAYNIVAAVSAALTLGIKPVHIQEAIANYKPQAGRMETFIINNHPVILNLVKNPTGLNQSILAVIQSQSQKNLFFALNDKDADGKDISWI